MLRRSAQKALRVPLVRRLPLRRFANAATPKSLSETTDAWEIVDRDPAGKSGVLVTCEHASVRLPAPWAWSKRDRERLHGTHWSFDPGSEDFARELIDDLSCVGVFSRYSRLLIDPNRPLSSETLFRDVAEGQPVDLNKNLAAEDRARRIKLFYEPYHAALHSVVRQRQPKLVVSLHSFTPLYEGQPRKVEIGVLFADSDDVAKPMQERYSKAGYDARLNEPWSGKEGFMYAAQSVTTPSRKAVMLEFRQDLVVKAQWRADARRHLVESIRKLGY